MEILGTFGHWLAVFFFWVFVLMIILGLVMAVGSILVVRQHRRPSFAMPRPNDRTYIYVGLVIMGIAGLLAYIFLGLADYKSYVKTKYNQVVHFSSKEIRLEKKVKELSDLRTQLIQKQQEVKRLQTEYQNDIRTLTVEIKAEQRANNIQSFYQAQQHPRISYDLSLIQRKRAYIAKLQETEIKLQRGTYELEFLERQSIDDLKIVKTLGGDQVETLVTNINDVISKYLPEAGELAIEVDPKSMQTPEQIWHQINSGN